MDKNEVELLRKRLSHCIVDSCTGCPANDGKYAACKEYKAKNVKVPHGVLVNVLDILDEICTEEE